MTSARGPHLVCIEPARLPVDADGNLSMATKSYDGFTLLAQRWPGSMTVAYTGTYPQDAGSAWHTKLSGNEPFALATVPEPEALRALFPGLTVVTGIPSSYWVQSTGVPYAVIVESTPNIRMDIYRSAALTPISAARIRLGEFRVEHRMRRFIAGARGVLANGWAAQDAYGRFAKRLHPYNDHRVFTEDLANVAPRTGLRDGAQLTIAFSGRLTEIKGVEHIVRAASLLDDRGATVRTFVLGDGPLRAKLQADAPPSVEFMGALPFRPEWLEFVRSHVDLMVLPHVQGDPSCTYFEALGCGVPLLGFHNETFTRLLREWPVGRAVKRGDTAALTDEMARLAADPSPLWEWSRAAVEIMRERSYERVVDERVEFLRSLIAWSPQ